MCRSNLGIVGLAETQELQSTPMKRTRLRTRRRYYGQSLVEYAVILVLIAGVVVFGVVQVAPRVSAVFQQLAPLLSPDSSVTPVPTPTNIIYPTTPSATATPVVATPTTTISNGNGNGNNGCGNNGQGNHGAGNCH
jgi:Flp pilus assembly pilin Flp